MPCLKAVTPNPHFATFYSTYRVHTQPSNFTYPSKMQPSCPSFPPCIYKLNLPTKILTHIKTPSSLGLPSFSSSQLFPRMEWTRGHILGRGSSAVVSVATSVSGDVFAVKSCELSQSETLQNEQRFLSILSSPYLVSYKGCDITREKNKLMYNLFLEYDSRGTISDHYGAIKEPVIAHYARQILHGIDYIHSNGVVHCDIKGSNILIGENVAKIADLGCAKWAANIGAPLGGTPMYMAPEVARGEEQGFAADIWAFGCTVIEMATGGSPWPNNVSDPLSILYRIAFSGELPEFPKFLSDQAKEFLGKCLRRDKNERWTAKELLDHPFIRESKQNNQEFITRSPTSILDQDFWDSMEEETETEIRPSIIDQVEPCSWSSAGQRIEQLACTSGEAEWRWEETWTTIRSNVGDDEEEGCGPLTGWVGDDTVVEFNFSSLKKKEFVKGCSCSNNSLMMGWCTCVENSVGVGCLINLERCNVSPFLDQSIIF